MESERKAAVLIDQDKPTKAQRIQVKETPMGYVPVTFCTKGKLSAPPILHFRDYNMEEAIELSSITDENYLSRLVLVLNKMVHEDFDCSQLHLEELKEVLLTIHVNFWGAYLRDFSGWNAEKKKQSVDIPVASIQVDNLPDEFEEPINITDSHGNIVLLRFPRVGDNLRVQEYVDTRFAEEEKKHIRAKLQIERFGLKNIDKISNPESVQDYLKFLEKKTKVYNLAHRMVRVLKFNDEDAPTSMEESLAYASRIGLSVWASMKQHVMDKFTFGVNSKVIINDVEWRFQFRTINFLPSMELSDNPRNAVSFGT